MVDVDLGSLQADSQPKSLAWSEGRRLLGAVLHSSNEPGELSQWFCHDDSTINISICIIIIITYLLAYAPNASHAQRFGKVLFVGLLINDVYLESWLVATFIFSVCRR